MIWLLGTDGDDACVAEEDASLYGAYLKLAVLGCVFFSFAFQPAQGFVLT